MKDDVDGKLADMARAGLALGRLAEAAERSPLQGVWRYHESARIIAQLYSRGVTPLSAETLMVLGLGIDHGRLTFDQKAARSYWLQALRLWSSPAPEEGSESILESTRELAALRQGDLPPGELALQAPLLFARVTGCILPSVAAALPASGARSAWEAAFLSRLADVCTEALLRLQQLERDDRRWREALPDSRADSQLENTLVLLGTFYALTPRLVKESLGVTRQAAARLLRRLEAAGILRQVASRQRWLVYVPDNAAPKLSVPQTTNRSPQPSLDVDAVDKVLKDAYAALDRASRDSEPADKEAAERAAEPRRPWA